MENLIKEIADERGFIDAGAAMFVKRNNETKYHLWLPATNIPATGSAPEQVETTVTTARTKTYTAGRKDNPQKELTFLAHRDNYMILKQDYKKTLDFLQINPDGVGFKFKGEVSMYQDEAAVGSNMTGKAVITVKSSDELPIDNVIDLIQETVTFESVIDAVVKISKTGSKDIIIETDPSDATITASSDTAAIATATMAESGNKLTIAGVKEGSAIITIEASKSECAKGVTHILVVVE